MSPKNLPAGEPKMLEELAKVLVELSNDELDAKLERDGGITVSEERFAVFCEEYARRELRLPA